MIKKLVAYLSALTFNMRITSI